MPDKKEDSIFNGKQIYFITGSKGAGKTTAAFSFLRARDYGKCFYVDTEDSASDILRGNKELGLELGKYVRAYERIPTNLDIIKELSENKVPWATEKEKGALLQFYQWFIKVVHDELKKDKFDTFVLDTVEPLEAAVTAYVEDQKSKVGWSGRRDFGRMETEGVRPMLDGIFEGIHRLGVKRIILISHIKPVWLENKPVLNKIEPGGRLALWSRISTGMFWLVPNFNNADGAPAALILKGRFEKRVLDKESGFVVPRRILPQRMPRFSYADMLRYEEKPADLAHPNDDEKPTPAELDMMSELLNDKQMELMILGTQQDLLKQQVTELPLMPTGEFSLPPTVRPPTNGG